MTDNMEKLGYDAGDIHWLHCFYNCGSVIVHDPRDTERRDLAIKRENVAKMDKLIKGGDKFYIDQAIYFGKVGLDYTMVNFKPK